MPLSMKSNGRGATLLLVLHRIKKTIQESFMEIYVVKSGDTVDSIAESHGIPVSSVIYNNQLVYPYSLALGQALLLSSGSLPRPIIRHG